MSDYITREELTAHLEPMRSDISEIKGDVKLLIGANAGAAAVKSYKTQHRGGFVSWSAIVVAAVSAAINFVHPIR